MPQDERGFHLEIHVLGKKKIHYYDKDLDRFQKKSMEIISNFLHEHGIVTNRQAIPDSGDRYAQNIIIKRYTV